MKTRLALPLFALAMSAALSARAQISISVNIAPPPLPVYEQPVIPADGYLWTPGYWSWNPSDNDYYWVPGTWVLAPAPGLLWTPGYWGYAGGAYRWNAGYWGDHVGFYGGVDYGFGYTGHGYAGGRWQGRVFEYNRSVNNINTTVVHNVYNTTVVNNYKVTRVSFNGGPGGVNARPSATELQADKERHVAPTTNQVQHEHTALAMPAQRASVNHGAPQVAATPKPSAFAAADANRTGNAHQATVQPVQRNSRVTEREAPPPTRPAPEVAKGTAPAHDTPARTEVPNSTPEAHANVHAQQKPPVEQHAPARAETPRPAAPQQARAEPPRPAAPQPAHPETAKPAQPQAREETPRPPSEPARIEQAKAGGHPETREEGSHQ